MNAKLQMILSMVIFGTISIFVRQIPLTSAEVALFRASIALVCLLAVQLAQGKPPALRGMGRDVLLLVLSGAAMGFNWIFLFEAYRYTTVSVATLSYYFAPVIVIVSGISLSDAVPTVIVMPVGIPVGVPTVGVTFVVPV